MSDKGMCEDCAFKDKCEKYKECLILKEKLGVAVACLRRIAKSDECSGCMDCMSSAYAERALEKIKEIK